MAITKAADSQVAVPLAHEHNDAPPPLDFFQRDAIDRYNQELIEHEQRRWRLLGRWERWKLRFYVWSLARQLQKAGYNKLVLEVHELQRNFRRVKAEYEAQLDESEKATARIQLHKIQVRVKVVMNALDDLKSLYENYTHFAGWLEYEQVNRKDLKREKAKDDRIAREMNREAKWLEQLLIDVFRFTPGCHYIYTDKDSGKPITKTPKFERSQMSPAAHYFWLSASQRWLFGYRWKLPYGVTINRLVEEDVIANMRAATKRQVDPVWSVTGQLMFRVSRLDSPDALPREVKWRDAMRFFPTDKRDKLPYTIGVNEARKFEWFNLLDDPHILVAGKSLSGKSNLVNGIIATLATTFSPDELRLVLIDQKGGLEFSHWYELPHVLWDITKTIDDVFPVLSRLVAVMRSRMTIMERIKAKKLEDYNSRVDQSARMARVLIVIDEMNTIVGMGKLTEEIHNLIMLVASQGRAVGIHLICATQHPEVKVIPGRIKTNMSMRLSGAMPSVTASMIILDSPEAARLPSLPGRFVCAVGLKMLTVQAPRIFDEDIAGVVSSTRKEWPVVSEHLSDSQPEQAAQFIVWNDQRVLVSCLEWLEGQLSAEKLHKMLGEESPGQRHLARQVRHILDHIEAHGCVRREDDGSEYRMKRIKRAYYLVPLSDLSDKNTIQEVEDLESDKVSE